VALPWSRIGHQLGRKRRREYRMTIRIDRLGFELATVLVCSALALAQVPADPPKKECTSIMTSGSPGHCSPITCSFLGTQCGEVCVTLERSGGKCVGMSTTSCVMSLQTFTKKLCQDCDCSGIVGSCVDSGAPQPSGTVEEYRCTQGS
jgi:hypothetical protein